MRPCQGRDRGFEPRRSRQSKETFERGSFLLFFCQVNVEEELSVSGWNTITRLRPLDLALYNAISAL